MINYIGNGAKTTAFRLFDHAKNAAESAKEIANDFIEFVDAIGIAGIFDMVRAGVLLGIVLRTFVNLTGVIFSWEVVETAQDVVFSMENREFRR